MKTLSILFGLLMVSTVLFSQAPENFKYQAVLRDASGNVKGLEIDKTRERLSRTIRESHFPDMNHPLKTHRARAIFAIVLQSQV